MPARTLVLRVLVGGLAVSAIFWYFGADVWHAVLLGSAVTSIVVAASACLALSDAGALRAPGWRSEGRSRSPGSRNDVTYLSASLRGRWGRVGLPAETRVRQLAQKRLAVHDLDLNDPDARAGIEQLVDRRTYRLLAHTRRRPMRLPSLLHCLDALEGLALPSPEEKS